MKTIITVVSIILVAVLGLSIFSNLIDNGGFSNLFEESTSDVESSEPNGYTTITIGNKEYGIDNSVETWIDWCASKYNTDGFFITSDGEFVAKSYSVADCSGEVIVNSAGEKVDKEDYILRDFGYNVYRFKIISSVDVTFNISIQTGADSFYTEGGTVSKGTTWGVWCDEFDSDPDRLANIGDSWQAIDGYVFNSFTGNFIADAYNNKVLWSSEIVAGTYGAYNPFEESTSDVESSEPDGYTTITIGDKEYGIDDSIETWIDWCASEYNTDGFFITTDGMFVAKSYSVVDCTGEVIATSAGEEVDKEDYILRDSGSNIYTLKTI